MMEKACFGRSRIYRGREPKAVHGVIRIFASVMFLLLTLLGADVSAQTDCSDTSATDVAEAECQALVDFYNQTSGASWDINTNWNTDQSINTWYGVVVRNGQVEELSLSRNLLYGSIPDLSPLTSLEELDLSSNLLDGSIPDLSPLTSLEELDLSSNLLLGSIPDLSPLTSLEELDLSSNLLDGSIPDLSPLTSLEELDLSRNRLDGSIPDLRPLTSLNQLNLSRNQLDGSIPDLRPLTSLRRLDLSRNQLDGSIPTWLGDLTNLQSLYLAFNMLTGEIPDSLGDLTSLQRLYLAFNMLTGEIPDSLRDLTNLQSLDLDANMLTGSIPDLSPLTSLNQLNLYRNQLGGSIPDSLGDLTNLESLHLGDNMLTGEIPDLSLLTKLRQLNLSRNQLDGSIPDSLGDLTNLESLYLNTNMLTGSIPASLGNLTNLLHLYLNENMLTGSIPASLGNLTNLLVLNLNENMLTGSIPTLPLPPPPRPAPPPPPPPPEQVTGVMVIEGVEQLSVSWNPVSGADGYKVQWKSGSDQFDSSRQHVVTGGDTTKYTISNLAPGTEYTVRVIATKSGGAADGRPSPEMTGIPGAPPPPQVTGVMVTQGVEQLSVLWDSVSGADGYKVQWKSGSDQSDSFRQHVVTGGDTTSYTISNLAPGTEYTVRVIATKAYADDGTPSPEMTGIPGAPPPPQVTGVMVIEGVEQLSVSWNPVSGADGYKVQWKSGSDQFDSSRQHVVTGGDTASYTISNLAPGTEYTVRVIATKSGTDDGTPSPEMTGIPSGRGGCTIASNGMKGNTSNSVLFNLLLVVFVLVSVVFPEKGSRQSSCVLQEIP